MALLDHEIKAKIDEKTHDDALMCSRSQGFDTRSDWVRFLIMRELYGISSMVSIAHIPGAIQGHKK